MITRLPLVLLVLALAGCWRQDLRETHVITNLSQPYNLVYQVKRDDGVLSWKVHGTMNGTLSLTSCGCEVSANCAEVERASVVYTDSIYREGGEEGTHAGRYKCLVFKPGTARKGRIEIEFLERGWGW